MYGLIGKFKAKPGERDALLALLLEASADMPGCRSYIVGRDLTDAEGIWVTEVWVSSPHRHKPAARHYCRQAGAKRTCSLTGIGITTNCCTRAGVVGASVMPIRSAPVRHLSFHRPRSAFSATSGPSGAHSPPAASTSF
ncbi:MAG: antibiotic biosynthesis monooxygenase [Gemmatimonadaceae bacterium]|nr:antibiotic biosynthesis monooxygenase [Gemmatimonadaceae bacterium]